MQTYIGVKIVQAEPAESKEGKEGFRVIYEEGYESWCPKEVFLKHNRPTDDLPFSFALEAAKQGKKISRRGWNGKGQYVFLLPDFVFTRDDFREIPALQGEARDITFWGSFCIMTSFGKVQVGWLATQSDMQADDWFIAE